MTRYIEYPWMQITFSHQRFSDGNGTVEPRGGVTVCYIHVEGVLVATEIAVCHPKDCYNKKIGREISKGRALKAFYATHNWSGPERPARATQHL